MNEDIYGNIKIEFTAEPDLLYETPIKQELDIKSEENASETNGFNVEILLNGFVDSSKYGGTKEESDTEGERVKSKDKLFMEDFEVDAVIGEIMANVDRDNLSKNPLEEQNTVTVKNADELPYHQIVINDKINEYCCTICDHAARTKGEIEVHILNHSVIKDLKKKSDRTQRKKDLQRSISQKRRISRKKRADYQDFRKTLYSEIEIANSTKYQCKACRVITARKYPMLKHIDGAHKDLYYPIRCSLCGNGLRGKNRLLFHLKTVHNVLVRDCDCDKDGNLKPAVERRICESLNQSRTDPSDFGQGVEESSNQNPLIKNAQKRLHVLLHKDKVYTCHICGEKFFEKRQFELHHKYHNTLDSPHHCTVCNYKSRTRVGLRHHMKTRHPNYSFITITRGNEKFFACPLCGKPFNREASVRIHYGMHKNESVYQCSLCPYRTRNEKSANHHVRRRHCVRSQTPKDEVKDEDEVVENNCSTETKEIISISSDDDSETEFPQSLNIEVAELVDIRNDGV